MRQINSVLGSIGALLLFSCGPREEVKYYPTGEVEYRAPLDEQGLFNGEVKNFYRNGIVKNIMPFRNNHINGLIKRYYPNGNLESTEFCKNGESFGPIKQYYPNGKLKYETMQYGNTHVDTARFYYSHGELNQIIVYDKKGRKVNFGVWYPNGLTDPRYIHPLFLSNTDTLREGQNFTFEIVLGNRRSNVITVKILSPASGLDSSKGVYTKNRYFIRHPSPGLHLIKAKVQEEWARKGSDTIWTNEYFISHHFRVFPTVPGKPRAAGIINQNQLESSPL